MSDAMKTTEELIQELAEARTRIAELEASEAKRKQAEKALWESEEKHRTILGNIEEGYYEVDLAGNLTLFNDALCRLTGDSNNSLWCANSGRYGPFQGFLCSDNRHYRTQENGGGVAEKGQEP